MPKQKNRTDLYAKDSTGNIRRWSIWREKDFICMEYGVEGGEIQENSEPVVYGLAGRSKKEQIKMRMDSRINKKIDQGYTRSLKQAKKGNRTNALGYTRPMNAIALSSLDQIPKGEIFLQRKYNGHRCMIINDCGTNVAYSKNGKLIETIPEILKEIDIPEGCILDGELYHHRTVLQTISSWVRRRQENTKNLEFVCFDAVVPGSFFDRYSFLQSLRFGEKSRLAETTFLKGEFNIIPVLKNFLEDGYEGIILRCPNSDYQDGKRNKAMMKVKRRTAGKGFVLDDEFLVVNIKESVDGFARLICETEEGLQFGVLAHGDHEEKALILKNKKDYIGKHIRIEFEEYTKAKKPFHPVAIEWREKSEE